MCVWVPHSPLGSAEPFGLGEHAGEGVGPAHSREVPLRHMRDMFGDVSSKAHTDSYTNYPHFPVAYKVHHRMRRDN